MVTMPEVKGDGGKVVGSGTYICTCIRAPFCCVVLCCVVFSCVVVLLCCVVLC